MPSAGIAVCGGVSRFAVGKPSALPRWWPRTTTPSTRCGRPSAFAAPVTSPAASSSPDRRRRDRRAVGDEQRHPLHSELVLLAELGQERDVAGRLVAEPEVLPHHDYRGVKSLDQDGAHELIGVEPGELQREREHAHGVGAQAGEQLRAAARRTQERRMAAGPDDLIRVRVEGDHHHRQVALPACLRRARDNALMAPVHAVEHANGDDGLAPLCRHLVQAVPAVHVLSLRSPRTGRALQAYGSTASGRLMARCCGLIW